MTKRLQLLLDLSLTACVLLSCQGVETQPPSVEPVASVEVVTHTAIPRPYPDDVYFLYGDRVKNGSPEILQQLLTEGIAVRYAWEPYEYGPCMRVILDQIIVQLKAPDSRIYAFGFTSDSGRAAPGVCIPTWKQYTF